MYSYDKGMKKANDHLYNARIFLNNAKEILSTVTVPSDFGYGSVTLRNAIGRINRNKSLILAKRRWINGQITKILAAEKNSEVISQQIGIRNRNRKYKYFSIVNNIAEDTNALEQLGTEQVLTDKLKIKKITASDVNGKAVIVGEWQPYYVDWGDSRKTVNTSNVAIAKNLGVEYALAEKLMIKKSTASEVTEKAVVGTWYYNLINGITNTKKYDKKTTDVKINSNGVKIGVTENPTGNSGGVKKVNIKTKVEKDNKSKNNSLNIDAVEKSFKKLLEGANVEISAIKSFSYKNEVYRIQKNTFVLTDSKLDKAIKLNNKFMSEIIKSSEAEADTSLQRLKDISTNIFNAARETLNGETKNLDINYTAAISEMSELLKNVKKENREVAEIMMSESILDLRYITNPKTKILSLRLADEERNIVIE